MSEHRTVPAECRQCRALDQVVWRDDLVQVLVGGPMGLPYVARVTPLAHTSESDLDAATRRRIGRVLKRISTALHADEQIADIELSDTGSGAAHLQVLALARPLRGTYDAATPLAMLNDLLPEVHPDTIAARTERVVAALDAPARWTAPLRQRRSAYAVSQRSSSS